MGRGGGLLLLGVCLVFAGCQKQLKYESPNRDRLPDIYRHVTDGKGYSRQTTYKKYAEQAVLYFYKGEHENANAAFEKAFQYRNELYTRSLTELLASKVINERAKTFRGHYLENWQLRVMALLNRLQLKDIDGALVETRRLSRDIRLSEDPFQEKRPLKIKQRFLAFTGTMFSLLGRSNEGFSDLRLAYDWNKDSFPSRLKAPFLSWASKRMGEKRYPAPAAAVKHTFHSSKPVLKMKIELSGQGPEKIEKKMSLTMLGFWPLIHGYLSESKEEKQVEQIQSVIFGTLGKRLVTIAYPVFRERGSTGTLESLLPFSVLMLDSWDAQKNKMIAQSALRVILKIITAEKVSREVENAVGQNWGWLIGNLSRTLIWETEKADTRQILYLPASIDINWEWKEGDQPGIDIDVSRASLF